MKKILIISERLNIGEGIEKTIKDFFEEKGIKEEEISINNCYRDYQIHEDRYSPDLFCIIYTGVVRSRDEDGVSDLVLKYGKKEINKALAGNKIPLIYARGYFTGSFNNEIKENKIKRKLNRLL